MSILDIRVLGDPVLREETRPVVEITEELRTLVKNMFATMYLAHRDDYDAALIPILERTLRHAGRQFATDPEIAVRLLVAVYDDAVRSAILVGSKTYDLAVVRDTIVRVVLALTRRAKQSPA